MNKSILKGSTIIGLGLITAIAAGGTFALWNDQSTVSGGEIYSGNLDLNVTNASWEDVSLKDGSKGSQESLDKVTASGPITDISDFRIVPGDTVIGTYDVQVALEGEHALADLLVDFQNSTVPNEIEVDYRINNGSWININDNYSILFSSPNYADAPIQDSLIASNLEITPGSITDVIVELRLWFKDTATENMQTNIPLNSVNFTLTQVRALLPQVTPEANLSYSLNDSNLVYDVTWEDPNDPSITGYQVTVDEYSANPSSGGTSLGTIVIQMNNTDPNYIGSVSKTVGDTLSTTVTSTNGSDVKYAIARVEALNRFGSSDKKTSQIEQIILAPDSVDNVELTPNVLNNNHSYDITWTDTTNSNHQGYKITLTGYDSSNNIVFTEETTVSSSVTSTNISRPTGVTATTVKASVSAYNSSGYSPVIEKTVNDLPDITNIVSVAAGGSHSLALDSEGKIYAWGLNSYGQLGNNSTTDSSVPVQVDTSGVLAGKTITAIAAGVYHSMALDSEGKVYAWGNNASGRLGNNSTSNSSVPVQVDTSGVLAGKTITAISGGGAHSLAIDSDGKVYAWGLNSYGQLGNNSPTNSSVPVQVYTSGVLAGKTITAIAAGSTYSLAIDSEGKVYAWGYNNSGQLGNNSTTNSNIPVQVNTSGVLAGKTITAISVGDYYSMALDSAGKVYTWGRNDSGQLGNNSTTNSSVPVQVNASGVLAGKTITTIAAGGYHSLTLDSEGKVYAWGNNSAGRLGNNSTTSASVPVQVNTSGVLAGKTITTIAAGNHHSLALDSDGKVYTWGLNGNGQLGNNSTTNSSMPVQVNFE